jgi:mannosyl-3-phosphoglycerate phosphatase
MSGLLIFTDLDGTLLDHDSYGYADAEPALKELRRRGIPLVLASSKTRLEMTEIHRELDLDAPFICENGAAICEPDGEPEALAMARAGVLEVLARLRRDYDFSFTGFNDCTDSDIAALTGLPPDRAALAAAREYSEPILWRDTPARRDLFLQLLSESGLQAQQGGRFLAISGPCDKAAAMAMVTERYVNRAGLTTVALGDSPNDLAMLAAADIAVIVASARSADMQLPGKTQLIRTRQPGPRGWRSAILELLAQPATSEGG